MIYKPTSNSEDWIKKKNILFPLPRIIFHFDRAKTRFVIRSRTLVSFVKRSSNTDRSPRNETTPRMIYIYINRAKNWRAVSIRRRIISRGRTARESEHDGSSVILHALSSIRKPPIRYQLPFVKSRNGPIEMSRGRIQGNPGQSVELSDINHSCYRSSLSPPPSLPSPPLPAP